MIIIYKSVIYSFSIYIMDMQKNIVDQMVEELQQSDKNLLQIITWAKKDVADILEETKITVSAWSNEDTWRPQYKIISVKESLAQLQLDEKTILAEKYAAIEKTWRWYKNISPLCGSAIYAAIYLKYKGTPNSYETYTQFMNWLNVTTDLYKTSLYQQAQYISQAHFADFLQWLSYAYNQHIYNEKYKQQAYDAIRNVIHNIPWNIRENFIDFLQKTNEPFGKAIVKGLLTIW